MELHLGFTFSLPATFYALIHHMSMHTHTHTYTERKKKGRGGKGRGGEGREQKLMTGLKLDKQLTLCPLS